MTKLEVTVTGLKAVSLGKPTAANMNSIVMALDQYGKAYGLDYPHRFVHYLAQLAHESGGYTYDRELWGPTAAQKRYDTRTDLGNTKAVDGDGELYKGRTPGQITGKANYMALYDWAKKGEMNPPDFVKKPDLLNTDPWEGLGPIWYWDQGNPTHKSLNQYADINDIESITKRINGGLNGFDDRVRYYTRFALHFLGYNIGKTTTTYVAAIKQFQKDKGLVADGDPGPQSRAAMHAALVAMHKAEQPKRAEQVETSKSPVVEKKEVPVAPKGVTKPGKDLWAIIIAAISGGSFSWLPSFFAGLSQTVQLVLIAVAVAAVAYVFYSRVKLAGAAKEIIQAVNDRNTTA